MDEWIVLVSTVFKTLHNATCVMIHTCKIFCPFMAVVWTQGVCFSPPRTEKEFPSVKLPILIMYLYLCVEIAWVISTITLHLY